MAAFGDRVQALMDEVYTEWQKEENKGKSKWDVLSGFSDAHQIAVVLGNFNYQVGNGGIEQWIYNGYFHDDAEKLTEYLEIGAVTDERCRTILDRIYKLNGYAQETDYDRDGYYNDEDGDSYFIGDMINCDAFDTWYYDKCDGDDWWQVVCGIIDKVTEREPASDRQDERGGEAGLEDAPPIVSFGERPSPYRDGNAEGPHESDGEQFAVTHPLRVYIENVHDESIGGFTMPLPTTPELLRPFLENAEIHGWQDMKIWEVLSDIGDLGDMVSEGIKKTMSPDALDELNYLAAKIEDMHPSEYEVFAAALEAKRHCNTVAELINLTENLDRFYIQPAFNPAMYGEHLLDMEKDNTAAVFLRLEHSDNPDDRAFAQYILRLEAHVDEEAYGRYVAEQEKGAFTKFGYLTESEGFKEVYRGPEDIPAEHRVFVYPEPKQYFRGETADLAAFVYKLHALAGEYMSDAHFNVSTLANGSEYYLMLMNGKNIHLCEMGSAYRRENTANDIWFHQAVTPDTMAFMLHVTDRNGDRLSGSITELDHAEQRQDIISHGFDADYIDAVLKDGTDRIYPPTEWRELEPIDRDRIQSWERHYNIDAIDGLTLHLEDSAAQRESSAKRVPPEFILGELNSVFTEEVTTERPDIFRIARAAAKEITARGDAPVYRLLPDKDELLTPLDVVRHGLVYGQHNAFAVKSEDIDGFLKWAERGAADIVRRAASRDEREKPKSHGQEH